MGLLVKFFNQTRKPEGTLGKIMLESMNYGHAKLAQWGFTHLPSVNMEQIIDLGCGAGGNAARLIEKYPDAHVTALDYSALSVEKTKKYNSASVISGRCEVLQGDVSDIRLPGENFDLATAFETIYFWPDTDKCFSRICGILKKGGIFMICNESDGYDSESKKFEKIIDGMKSYTSVEIEAALKNAGFSQITRDHHPTKPWIAIVAVK